MARRRPGNKPLSEPMMVSLLMHICITRPQWYSMIKFNEVLWHSYQDNFDGNVQQDVTHSDVFEDYNYSIWILQISPRPMSLIEVSFWWDDFNDFRLTYTSSDHNFDYIYIHWSNCDSLEDRWPVMLGETSALLWVMSTEWLLASINDITGLGLPETCSTCPIHGLSTCCGKHGQACEWALRGSCRVMICDCS